MPLDTTSFGNALNSLASALQRYDASPHDDLYRDACIQRFEYSYELSHKMLRRFLEMTEPSRKIVEEMSFPTLIRTGFERGLVRGSWDVWEEYRKKRGTTSHAYDEDKANEVFESIPGFLEEARYLLDELRRRADQA